MPVVQKKIKPEIQVVLSGADPDGLIRQTKHIANVESDYSSLTNAKPPRIRHMISLIIDKPRRRCTFFTKKNARCYYGCVDQ
jgi:hypothetical protein